MNQDVREFFDCGSEILYRAAEAQTELLAPGEDVCELGLGLGFGCLLDGPPQPLVAQEAFGIIHPGEIVGKLGHLEAPFLHHRVRRQELGEDAFNRLVAVGAAGLREEVGKLLALTSRLCQGLQRRCCTARSKSLTSLCRSQSHPAQYVSMGERACQTVANGYA